MATFFCYESYSLLRSNSAAPAPCHVLGLLPLEAVDTLAMAILERYADLGTGKEGLKGNKDRRE